MINLPVHIRRMQPSDIGFAIQLALNEDWKGQDDEIFQSFLAFDSKGCFIAEKGKNRIGICIATGYRQSGFIGELIVMKSERGQGIGKLLLDHSIAYLGKKGVKSIYLDGVSAAVPLYERTGFRKICRSLRFSGQVRAASHSRIRQMRMEDFHEIGKMDTKAFGDDRTFFLKRRFTLNPELCYMMERNGSITGYLFIKKTGDSVSIGPWWLGPDVQSPEALLTHLALKAQHLPLRIGVLETNIKAVELLRSMNLKESPDPPWRMVLGPKGNLGLSDQFYAIGSAAKG
jgi:GNAT superfamily N-acetyltransferase